MWSTIDNDVVLQKSIPLEDYLARSAKAPLTVQLNDIDGDAQWDSVLKQVIEGRESWIKQLYLHYRGGSKDFILGRVDKNMSSLTTLGLRYPPGVLSVDDVMGVLKAQPQLQNLLISGDMQVTPNDAGLTEKAALSTLSSLRIEAGLRAVATLFGQLVLPNDDEIERNVGIHLDITVPGVGNDEPGLLHGLLQSLETSTIVSWSHARLINDDGRYTVQIVDKDKTCTVSLQLPSEPLTTLAPFFIVIDKSTVRKLVVREHLPLEDPNWAVISRWFTGVEDLTLTLSLLPSFFRAVIASGERSTEFFPELKLITSVVHGGTQCMDWLSLDEFSSARELLSTRQGLEFFLTPGYHRLDARDIVCYREATNIFFGGLNPTQSDKVKAVQSLFQWRPAQGSILERRILDNTEYADADSPHSEDERLEDTNFVEELASGSL
ncbi:hypothetical protein BDN72DRAFT_864930 [Pluteus cervinus]|uniref:Uncharacterized protein n=1 Tax=Pluteus cervinus TaxID=181527 RepID=A0ACD3A233_9AGAR|nr:hypothetical protein BDN72DRAFT_864930 [Pluteus cervinus]